MGNKACCDDKVVGGEFGAKERQEQPAGLANEEREAERDRAKAKEEATNSKNEESRAEVPVKKESQLLSNESQHIELPLLTPEVNNVLQTKNFFKEDFVFQQSMKPFDSDIYSGQLNEQGIPNGLGKLYRVDGCLYIGNFEKGKAHGKGALIFSNGSYYHGDFLENHAEGLGQYWSKDLEYSGEFKGNFFHGQGKEKGIGHSFRGEYERGNKKEGLFVWKAANEEYEYFGTFAGNRFEGRGTLKQPMGTYRGDFIKGEKHGRGVYEFLNGLRYEGEYRYGQRSGHGALYDCNNVLAYEGEFQKGLPHGEGVITSEEGGRVTGRWVQGIDEDLL